MIDGEEGQDETEVLEPRQKTRPLLCTFPAIQCRHLDYNLLYGEQV